ncbi:hypothetical protein GBAR_LOCUS388, partial [Geodia barretti]
LCQWFPDRRERPRDPENSVYTALDFSQPLGEARAHLTQPPRYCDLLERWKVELRWKEERTRVLLLGDCLSFYWSKNHCIMTGVHTLILSDSMCLQQRLHSALILTFTNFIPQFIFMFQRKNVICFLQSCGFGPLLKLLSVVAVGVFTNHSSLLCLY